LCFGPQDLEQPPSGVLHPRRVADGVVAGIEDYGNKMGIPTINGAILYQEGYTANPLVFCGCLGILPHGSHPTGARAGDLIVLIGGRTGRDGLRGATFSSMEMDVQTSEIASVSVQIGHPIHEKQVLEVMLRARDEKLYSAVTDCGAGGLSSAVGEMAGGNGASVQLETVPLKYPGLRPWEIWLSEAQERMVLAVPPENWSRMQEICRSQNLEGVCIGQFEATGRLRLTHNGQFVGDLSIDFLHDGIPQRHLKAQWQPVAAVNQSKMDEIDPADTLLRLLEHPNIRSKESVVRRYDHEVQGATAVKPFTGVDNHGPSDAAVLVPLDTLLQDASSARAVALSNGINPFYGLLDPYLMAWAAVDEAVRNLVAVGADPDQIAILDNFCWGNPNLPDRLGALVRCVQGCYDAALAYGTPFISGKDSLNNEYADADGVKHAIPGTLLISAMGIVPDVRQTVTMDLKQAGNYLYLLGETRNELGGSHYHLLHHLENGMPPQPVPQSLELMRRLHQAMRAGLVRACHDVSEGGIAVSLAEMCIAGRLGAEVYIHNIASPDLEQADLHKLFTESSGRFIVEVEQGKEREFAAIFEHYPCHVLGVVRSEAALVIKRPLYQHNEAIILDLPVGQLEKAWRGYSNADVVKDHSKKSAANTNGSMYEQVVQAKTTKPKVLILHATGTNRDRDAALACELAGGTPEIVHVNQLLNGDRCLRDYHMLVIPGGFSYGDDLGAGMLWSLEMQQRLNADISHFVQEGRPVIGICNGFQMLAKAGLLDVDNSHSREITLTKNQSRQFECRWVYLQANSRSHNLFIRGVNELIYCPVAHGEGRIASTSANIGTLAALYYADVDGNTASTYPLSPNGSIYGIAGLSNAAGNVLGLMPHPENHIFSWQHPRWRQGESGMDGLRLFKNGIKHA
jgi:phosphoribosylformylglycinamidine synthase II/phosphoribosylformylglycinamidine synthase I